MSLTCRKDFELRRLLRLISSLRGIGFRIRIRSHEVSKYWEWLCTNVLRFYDSHLRELFRRWSGIIANDKRRTNALVAHEPGQENDHERFKLGTQSNKFGIRVLRLDPWF